MHVAIDMQESEIRQAISDFIMEEYGIKVDPNNLIVEVKSKQNYRSEWEQASIRVNMTTKVLKP